MSLIKLSALIAGATAVLGSEDSNGIEDGNQPSDNSLSGNEVIPEDLIVCDSESGVTKFMGEFHENSREYDSEWYTAHWRDHNGVAHSVVGHILGTHTQVIGQCDEIRVYEGPRVVCKRETGVSFTNGRIWGSSLSTFTILEFDQAQNKFVERYTVEDLSPGSWALTNDKQPVLVYYKWSTGKVCSLDVTRGITSEVSIDAKSDESVTISDHGGWAFTLPRSHSISYSGDTVIKPDLRMGLTNLRTGHTFRLPINGIPWTHQTNNDETHLILEYPRDPDSHLVDLNRRGIEKVFNKVSNFQWLDNLHYELTFKDGTMEKRSIRDNSVWVIEDNMSMNPYWVHYHHFRLTTSDYWVNTNTRVLTKKVWVPKLN